MREVDKLIRIAKAEIGYIEKKDANYLDQKSANTGFNNYTKYARDLDKIVSFYNGKKQGFPWCDVFVDWCFVKAFGEIKARELLFQPSYSLGAGVGYSKNYFVKNKAYYKDKPQIGDQIFFKNSSGSIMHTGIVCNVDNKYVYTIEGNTSELYDIDSNGGCVCMKKYLLNHKGIDGYGRPRYEDNLKEEDKLVNFLYVYNCDSLNVRKGPGTNYKILRTILYGETVIVYETRNGWSRIGSDEWVSGNYLTQNKPNSKIVKRVYNCLLLNVRNKPSLKGKVVGTLKVGTIVDVYTVVGNWARISLESAKYVYNKYLK